jgi:hypothetical protein
MIIVDEDLMTMAFVTTTKIWQMAFATILNATSHGSCKCVVVQRLKTWTLKMVVKDSNPHTCNLGKWHSWLRFLV